MPDHDDLAASQTDRLERELSAASAGPYTVTGWFTTNVGPSLHYTLRDTSGRELDYWRMPDGAAGAQIRSNDRWFDLDPDDPRYQAVIEGVREYEARNPDLAVYNNPQAAIVEPGPAKTADRYVVARINKTYRTLGERPGPQHVGKTFVPYDDRHLSKQAAEESAEASNDRYRPSLHGKTYIAVRAEPVPGTNKFRNLDHPSLTSKVQAAGLKVSKAAPLDAPAGALIAALRAAPEGDVLWTKEGDAWWIARNAPMDVLLRAGDLLRIPHVDHYSQIGLADEVTRAARGPAIAAAVDSAVKLTVDSSQGRGRRFEVTRVPEREGYGILSVLDPASGHVPDPFLLLIDGRRVGGTYWCTYNPAPSGFGRDDGGLPGRSWASWGPRGLSCGHPTRDAAEQAQVDVYKTDPDGWDMRLAGGHAELTPERDRPDGARFWDHRTNRDFWAGYAATLARVRAERPSTVDGVAAILSGFQAPSAGIAFFGNNADDQLSDALADAGWQLRFLERDYLWEARHPGTGERLNCVEGDVYPGPYETAASANPSATTQSVQAEGSIDYPDPVRPGATAPAAARPAAANQVRPPAARRTP